jgi:malate synthase
LEGLEHNIAVGILFIQSWISEGKGCFEFKGFVEDSATAEISRSQVIMLFVKRISPLITNLIFMTSFQKLC